MSDTSTAIIPPQSKKDIKYSPEVIFLWIQGERAPTARKVTKDFRSTIHRKVLKEQLLPVEEREWGIDQLVEKYPAPTDIVED